MLQKKRLVNLKTKQWKLSKKKLKKKKKERETLKKAKKERKDESNSEIWDFRRPNMCIISLQRRGKEIMAKKFPNLIKTVNPHI